MVIIGSTTTYTDDGSFDVPIKNLNAHLLMKSLSLNGFMMTNYVSDYKEYLSTLIPMIAKGELIAKVDMGESCPGGKFNSLDDTVRAEEWLHSGKNLGKVVVQVNDV